MAFDFVLEPSDLALGGAARLVSIADNEVRIRTGIWNFEEAVIDVSGEEPALGAAVIETLQAIATDAAMPASVDSLDPVARASLDQLLSDLVEGGYLVERRGSEDPHRILNNLLGRPIPLEADLQGQSQPVVALVSDTPSIERHLQSIDQALPIELIAIDNDVVSRLRQHDLTTRIDGRATIEATDEFVKLLSAADILLVVMRNASMGLLRNLNRVAEAGSLRMVISLLDGPFLNVLGIHPPNTGCLECFEQRSLARQEDHVAYHRFANATLGADDGTYGPILALAADLALVESAMWATGGSTRSVGRVLGVYLPTFELQAQRLLRIPSCPACGQYAKERLREINFSTRAALDRVVNASLR